MTPPILDVVIDELQKIKKLADKSIAQVDDAHLWAKLDPDANSIGVLMRHMAGNMRSRWTDFRTTDGEKPDRHRDHEFEEPLLPRDALITEWEDGWRRLFDALASISDADLGETIYIRREPHTIYKGVTRQLSHYAGHTYQILLLAKHFKGAEWKTLSIPRGQSEEFNQRMVAKLTAPQP
jgi:hypothetical protein